MPSTLGNWGANIALAALLNDRTLYLGLHVSNPNVLDPSVTEVVGGDYVRKPIAFAVPSGRSTVSTTGQNYAGMPAATITYLAVWSAIAGGLMAFCIDTTAHPLVVAANGFIYVPVGDVALSF